MMIAVAVVPLTERKRGCGVIHLERSESMLDRAERGKWMIMMLHVKVHVTIVILLRRSSLSVFATRAIARGAAFITVDNAMMVPFDSSRQELSNGCHIVILVKI